MDEHGRRAVGGERVVEGRVILQLVDPADVVEEEPEHVLARDLGPVEVDVLPGLPVVGAHADQVPLVGDDVVELVLLEEPREGRIALAALLARLHGDRDVASVREAEAHKDVGDRIAHPVRGEEVGRLELREIEGRIVPARREIGFGAVVEVPDVVDGHALAVDRDGGQHGDLRLPVAIVRGWDAEPPREDDRENGEEADERPAAPWQQREGEERPGGEEHGKEPCGGKVRVPDRERRPRRHPRDGEAAYPRGCNPRGAPHESVPRAHHPGGNRSRIWCTAASTRFARFSSEM